MDTRITVYRQKFPFLAREIMVALFVHCNIQYLKTYKSKNTNTQ
jgi:hypothetical protein